MGKKGSTLVLRMTKVYPAPQSTLWYTESTQGDFPGYVCLSEGVGWLVNFVACGLQLQILEGISTCDSRLLGP